MYQRTHKATGQGPLKNVMNVWVYVYRNVNATLELCLAIAESSGRFFVS